MTPEVKASSSEPIEAKSFGAPGDGKVRKRVKKLIRKEYPKKFFQDFVQHGDTCINQKS
jgi:hypothetical protein